MSKAFVCRCEDVTVRECNEAMALGHQDMESLKRYTGLGTGYCQGKSCMAAAAELLRQQGHSAEPFTARPPFQPVALADLATLAPLIDADEASGQPPH